MVWFWGALPASSFQPSQGSNSFLVLASSRVLHRLVFVPFTLTLPNYSTWVFSLLVETEYRWSIPYKTNKLKLPLFLKRIVSVYFSIFLSGFGSMSLIFRVILCQPRRVGWGGRWGGGSRQRGHMHTYG